MPLNAKGKKIKHAMEKEYGEKKGEQVFYASENKGSITGVTKHKGFKHEMAKKMKARAHSGAGMGRSHYSGKHYNI